LTNIPDRPFIVVSGGSGDSDWTVSGEIVENPGVIRVYTRLIRSGGRSIEAGFHADFERDEYLTAMLSGGGERNGPSSPAAHDVYESDSFDHPLAVDLGAGDGGPLINRTIHAENDEDFFLLAPDTDGTLAVETTGNIDT
jgi:hypothetical protein